MEIAIIEKPTFNKEIKAEITGIAKVEDNINEAKEFAIELKDYYKNITFMEEQMKNAKDEKAKINKMKTRIADYRKDIVAEFKKPIDNFEKEAKETEKILTETYDFIDVQVKNFEQQKKDEKLKQIVEYFQANVDEYEGLINFDLIFNERWLNVTYSLDTVQKDIIHVFAKTKQDLVTIDGQIKDDVINKQTKDFYFRNIAEPSVLSLSLQEGIRVIENNKRLEELEQKKKEELQQLQANQSISTKSIAVVPGHINNDNPELTEKLLNTMSKEISQEYKEFTFKVWLNEEQKIAMNNIFRQHNIKFEILNRG